MLALVLVLTGSTLLPTSVSDAGGEEGGGGGGREGLARGPADLKDPSIDVDDFPADFKRGAAGFGGIPTDFVAVNAGFEGVVAGLEGFSSDLESTRADFAGEPPTIFLKGLSTDFKEDVKTGLEDTAGFGDPPGFERGRSGLETVCGTADAGLFEGGCAGLERGLSTLEAVCGCDDTGLFEGGWAGLAGDRSGLGERAGFKEPNNSFLAAIGGKSLHSLCFSADITSDMRTLM